MLQEKNAVIQNWHGAYFTATGTILYGKPCVIGPKNRGERSREIIVE